MIIKRKGDSCSFCGKPEGHFIMNQAETANICMKCIINCIYTFAAITNKSLADADELKAIIHNLEIGQG